MYAIVKTGGRQLRVEPKTTVKVDHLPQTVGDGVEFTEVLAVHNDTELTVGTPYVENAKVIGRIVQHGKDPKIRVRTFRAKKRTRRHIGHRQQHTLIQILEIEADQIADEEIEDEVEETLGEDVEEPEEETDEDIEEDEDETEEADDE